MTIAITVAVVDDAPLIAALNRDVQQLHAELEPAVFRSDAPAEELAAHFAAMLAVPENQFRIATTEAGPSGYIWFELQDRPQTALTRPRRRCYIHHLSVKVSARRQGIASALLDRAEREAQVAGFADVALSAWVANRPAQAFFASRGFTPFSVSLGKRR